jgi:4-hydroxy-tetrahydrodipicolinate synthase
MGDNMGRELAGVIPILPTPFAETGSLDVASLRRVVNEAIVSGVSAIAHFGVASEYYKLSDEERDQLAALLPEAAAGRVPVILSVTPHATMLAVEEARRFASYGADALMLMPPFFLQPSIASMLRHIRAVAECVDLPIILQYAPLQTGRSIDVAVLTQLCRDLPNLNHIKIDLLPSGPLISDLTEAGVRCLVGYMGLHLPEDCLRGTQGVMPTASIAPGMAKLWQLLSRSGSEAEQKSRDLHARMLPFLNFVMQSVEMLIACEKIILKEAGILTSAYSRAPAVQLDATQHRELREHIRRLGDLLLCG